MSKFGGKATKYVAIIFLTLLISIAVIILFIPSHYGVKTALYIAQSYIDIEYEGFEGSLYTELGFDKLEISTGGANVNMEDLQLSLSLRNLLDLKGQIDALHLKSLQVELLPSQPQQPAIQTKEYIDIPYFFGLRELRIDEVLVILSESQRMSVSNINLKRLAFENSSLDIKKLGIDSINLIQRGQSQAPSEPFNLTKMLKTLQSAPMIKLPDIFIPININIPELRLQSFQQTQADDTSITHISGLESQIAIIQQEVSTRLSIIANNIGSGIAIDIRGNINLAEKFAHQLNIMARNNAQMLSIDADGNVEKTNITILDDKQSILSLGGEIGLQKQSLPVSIKLEIKTLQPIVEFLAIDTPPMQVEQLQAFVSGDWQQGYQFDLGAQLEHPGLVDENEISNINGKLAIVPSSLTLKADTLEVSGKLGTFSLTGSTKVVGDQLNRVVNNYQILSDNLQLQLLDPRLPKDASGKFDVISEVTQQTLTFHLTCADVKAELQNLSMVMGCDVSLDETGKIVIKQLRASAGNNKIESSGELTLPSSALWQFTPQWVELIDSSIALSIDANDLSALVVPVSGQLRLSAAINGKLNDFTADIDASSRQLEYENMNVASMQLTADVDAKKNWLSNIELNADDVFVGNQMIQQLVLDLSGDTNQHTLVVNLDASEWSSVQKVTGHMTNMETLEWKGVWETAEVAFQEFNFTKQSKTDIAFSVSNKAGYLKAHCWLETTSEAQLCFDKLDVENQNLMIQADIKADLAVFLHKYRPDLIMAKSKLPLISDISGTYHFINGADLLITNLIQGNIVTQRHSLDLSAVIANMKVQKSEVNTVMFVNAKEAGRVGVDSVLSFENAPFTHQADLFIKDLDLSIFQRFVPAINRLKGKVNANLQLAGEPTKPDIFGELKIENGALILDTYTYPLSDFNQLVTFNGQSADIEGGFGLGEGNANFIASVGFADAITAKGEIKGKGLEFAYQKHEAAVSPDIQFAVNPEMIDIKGNITIDSTLIKIESLPESMKSPSSDLILIGEKQPEPILPIGLDIRLNVLVDPPEKGTTKIDALGLEATLSGDLTLEVIQRQSTKEDSYQPMQTYLNGYLNVLSGSYEAWGQALQIRKGNIHFNGVPSLPQFDVIAIRNPLNTQGDVVAGVRVTGNPVLPKVELFSEPQMGQASQLSYLLTGEDSISGKSNSEGLDTNTLLVNLLVNFGLGRSENRVSKLGKALGFDSLNIQTAGQGDGTQVQLTGRIADDLQVTYAVGLFDSASELILKYQLMPQLYVEATSSASPALDLFYEFSRGIVKSDSVTTSPAQ